MKLKKQPVEEPGHCILAKLGLGLILLAPKGRRQSMHQTPMQPRLQHAPPPQCNTGI